MLGKYTFAINQNDLDGIIPVINSVAAEKLYLQTDRYQPTPNWEELLADGFNVASGLLLIVVKYDEKVIGFGRLFPDNLRGRSTGNIGIVLLPPYRSRGIGTDLLNLLVETASEFGFQNLTADILETNLHSLRLFRRFGFSELSYQTIICPHLRGAVEEITMIRSVFGRTNAYVPDF